MAPKIIDLTGKKIGRLLVLRRHLPIVPQKPKCECLCDCGTKTVIEGGELRRKGERARKSCGCALREAMQSQWFRKGQPGAHRTHGQSKTPEYGSWVHARNRCENPKGRTWRYYGGRGIKMCARWRENFFNFLADMGKRPKGKSLDRYPNPDGNYEPGNCRWATQKEQTNNRSKLKRREH